MKKEIENIDDYIEIMNQIEVLIQKATKNGGIDTLDTLELSILNDLSLKANTYEKNTRANFLTPPQSISDMIKIKMMQLRLKQKDMAKLLDIAESRLSEIISGKRKVNMELAKKLHRILKIEAEFILQSA